MDNKSLSHSKYNCTYHIVFIPKYERRVMYGKLRNDVKEILKKLCKMKGVELSVGALCPDHVHMYVSIHPNCRYQRSWVF